MTRPRVFIVVPKDTIILGAYTVEDSAHLHEKCVEGAGVVECELLDKVPDEIREDLYQEWDGEEDTPVMPMGDPSEPQPPSASSDAPTVRTKSIKPRKQDR